MKNNAKNHSEPPSIIFSKTAINLSNEAKLLMPAENSVKRSLRRVINASYPPIVPVNELKVTGMWATTGGENPQQFLLYDNENNDYRVIIFSSPEALQILKSSKYWYVDGTFSTAPTGFNQVYVIHVKMGSMTIPSEYILLQNKTKQTYTEMLSVICEKCPNSEVVQITIDFEKAVVLAIEEVLPKVKIHCCYVHLCQSVWRKIQEYGLVKKYKEDKKFQRDVAMITGLAFLPVNYIKKGMCIMVFFFVHK